MKIIILALFLSLSQSIFAQARKSTITCIAKDQTSVISIIIEGASTLSEDMESESLSIQGTFEKKTWNAGIRTGKTFGDVSPLNLNGGAVDLKLTFEDGAQQRLLIMRDVDQVVNADLEDSAYVCRGKWL